MVQKATNMKYHNVWHDRYEFPKVGKFIVVFSSKYGIEHIKTAMKTFAGHKAMVDALCIEKWAYIEDYNRYNEIKAIRRTKRNLKNYEYDENK